MHEVVKQYISRKKAEQREKFEKTKAEKLIELGVFEKEFPEDPNNVDYNVYDCGFYDDDNTYRRYKRVPVDVSDEEYMEILKYSEDETSKKEEVSSNAIALTLQVFAWIVIIGGFIMGIINGIVYDEFVLAIAIVYWVVSFVSGFSLLAFAEILALLQKIYNNTKI